MTWFRHNLNQALTWFNHDLTQDLTPLTTQDLTLALL